MTTTSNTRGRAWAYLGAILGGSISVAANVAHSYIPPAGAPTDWQPLPGAVASSIAWPVILFVAIEILARVVWPSGRWWAVLRFGGMIPVAAVAGIVSYRHLSSLLDYYGEDRLVSVLGPLAVDGLMVMATAALLVIGHRTATVIAQVVNADTAPATRPEPIPAPAVPVVPIPVPDRPSVPEPVPVVPDAPAATVRATAPVITNVPALASRPAPTWPTPALPAELLDRARAAVAEFQQANGRQILRDELRAVLRVSNDTTGQVMRAIGLTPSRTVPVFADPVPVLNGSER